MTALNQPPRVALLAANPTDANPYIALLHAGLTDADHGAFHDVAALGGTDFFALPMIFSDGSAHGLSFATAQPDGFTADDLENLAEVADLITPAIEVMAVRRSMSSLLDTYLGRGASREVQAGTIRRGDVRTLDAVIVFTDFREFTNFSANHSTAEVIDTLDEYFEVVVDGVNAEGGEVLKFLGDGILAMFQIRDGDRMTAARSALKAVVGAYDRLAEANDTRLAAGRAPILFSAGLDLGEVAYGNIGGLDRLDFTVVGAAVNQAARIQGLCRVTKRRVLMSRAVADAAGIELDAMGAMPLKGVADPVELFACPNVEAHALRATTRGAA